MMTDVLGRERYRLERSLGIGAMGTVHLGRDTVLDRVVAIKVLAEHLATDDAFRQRFVREARLAARLCHPNVVQVFDAGDDGGRPFLVMEYVDGETVADRLARRRGFTGDELVALAAQLSAGLAHAHAEGIVHRDVKPQNVLIRRDGVAKLTDFGIARAIAESGLTEIGTVLGTAPYRAPEQAAGDEAGFAADVYGLGALLRHLAAGPLPPALEAIVDAATAPDPAARPSAAEVQYWFAALRQGSAVVAPTVAELIAGAAPTEVGAAPTEVRSAPGTELMPPTGRPAAPAPRNRLTTAVMAALGVVVLLVALQIAGAGRKPATGAPAAPTTTTTVPSAPTQAAHDLADWLRGQSR